MIDEMLLTRLGGASGDRQVAALREALQERAAHVQLLKESLLQARLEGAEALAAASKEQRAAQRKTKAECDSALRKLQDGMDKV